MIHSERVQHARRMWKRVAWEIVVVLTLVITTTIMLLAVGTLFDPTSNLFTFVSAGVGTTFAIRYHWFLGSLLPVLGVSQRNLPST